MAKVQQPNPDNMRYDARFYSDVGMKSKQSYDPPLDPGVKRYVEVLGKHGIETFESCQGGEGHSYPEPTVRFHGDRSEGFKALAIAQQHAFPVSALRRTWPIVDGEPTGPWWELTLERCVTLH